MSKNKTVKMWTSGGWIDPDTCGSTVMSGVHVTTHHYSKKYRGEYEKEYNKDPGPGRVLMDITIRLSDCSRLIEWGKANGSDGGFVNTRRKIVRAINELQTALDNLDKAEAEVLKWKDKGYRVEEY